MPGRIDLDIALGKPAATRGKARPLGEHLRVLLIGDLSGRSRHDGAGTLKFDPSEIATRPIVRLDLDNFDATLRRLGPCIPLDDGQSAIEFESLDDFHPDRLYARVGLFRALRESRARLQDPATFEQEANRLLQDAPALQMAAESAAPIGIESPANDGALLDRLLGASARPREPAAQSSTIDSLVRRLVQPHIQAGPARSPAPFIAAVDASLAEAMRKLLHRHDLQQLEAAWRGLRAFVDAVELGDAVELHVLDVSLAEWRADLAANAGDAKGSAIARRLLQVAFADEDRPWGVIAGLYSFAANSDDIALLACLGHVAASMGAPLLAAAEPGLAGCEKLADGADARAWAIADAEVERQWQALRQSAIAPWIGLALPRVLLRLPYGARTDAIDAFAFEELGAAHDDAALLWGNPALACAQRIAQAYVEDGTDFASSGPFDIDDLPAYVVERDGEKQLQPCAEVRLPTASGEELRRRGLIPLLSYGNRAAACIVALQSIAEPPRALAGLG